MCTPQRVENADGLPRGYRRGEEGIVLLLALIALLLISAVAASILFMASGESSLVGRQRTSTQVLYAGIGGLEEARMRLNTTDPNYLCFTLPAGSCDAQNNLIFPTAVNQVVYIFNPANAAEAAVLRPNVCPGGVQVDALGNETCPTNIYYDWEYQREFATSITNAAVVIRTVQSEQVAARAANPPWPVVTDKWTRITIKTEAAARQDINGDGVYDNVTPVFFDNDLMRQIVNVNCPGGACPEGARQVYRLTSLATIPDGTRRMVQYDVGGRLIVIDFPSTITMIGANLTCNYPNSAPFEVSGIDEAGVPGEGGPAIGVINPAEDAQCSAGLPRPNNYSGTDGTIPSVADISATADPDLLSSQGLQDLSDLVRRYADQTYSSPQAPTNYGSCDSNPATPDTPLITVVEGDLQISGTTEGCGILLVTGTLTFSGTPRWNGVVLVIGEGIFDYSGGGNQGIHGTLLIARIYDAAGNLLPAPDGSVFTNPGGGTADVVYNSLFINTALNRVAYRILAFREVTR